MKHILTVLAILTMTGTASAGSVLLASFDTFTSGGGAPESDPRLEFILELPSLPADQPPGVPLGLGTGRNLFFEDGELRSVFFDRSNDSNFAPFAQAATDGVDDEFMLWTLFPSGGGSGHIGSEPELFGTATDLIGNSLDFVRLTVIDVRVNPWIPDPVTHPEIEGFKYEAFLRYEFYGTPVPEPASLTLLLFGCIGTIWRCTAANRSIP